MNATHQNSEIRNPKSEIIRVLLIEDNPGDARLIREMLADGGADRFKLECADRLSTGLERLANNDIELVLLDLGLPDSQGFDTFTKTYAQAPGVPIIVLSNLADEQLAIKTVQEGAQDYLVKGHLDSHALVRTIRYAIERKRAEEALEGSRQSLIEAQRVARVGSWEWNAVEDVITGSEEFYRLFDVTPEEIARFGQFVERLHPDDRDRVQRDVDDALRQERPYDTDYRVKLRGDGWRDINARGSTFTDTDGKPVRLVGTIQDITERKRADAALREGEERYRTLFEASADGILLADLETRQFQYANPAICRMLGYTENELRTMDVAAIHPKADLPRVVAEFEARARGDKSLAPELPCLRKDGTIVYADINTVSITVDGRRCNAGFFRDVTERKQADAALRESEEQMRFVTDHAPVFIAQCDHERRYKFVNRYYAAMFGLRPADIIGKHPRDVLGEEAYAHASPHMEVTLAGQPTEYDLVLSATPGGPRAVHVKYEPERDASGRVVGFIAAILDITERKQAEEALKESEARFRTLFEAVPDSVLVHDDEGTILHINEIGAHQLEWSAKDLVGRNLRDIVTPESRASIADHIRETHKIGWRRFETTYVARSGWQIMVEVNERPIKFGKEKAILRVARDITERKEAEKALLKEKNFSNTIINSSPGLFFVFDDKGNTVQWNMNVEIVTGYSAKELSKMNILDFVAKENRKTAAAAIREVLTKGQSSLEINVLSKPGKKTPFHIIGLRTKLENTTCVVCTGIDITERKQAEEALRESEAHLKEAQRVGHLGSWDLNVVTGDLQWSDECYRIYGFRPQEFLPTYEKFRSIVHPEDLGFVQEQVDAALNNDKHYDVDFRFVRPNGEIGWLHCTGEVMRDAEGKQLRFFGTQIDITERKQVEEELQGSYHKLRETLIATVNALASTIEMRDSYTAGHQRRVTMLACAIAEEMGLTDEQFDGLRLAGLVHDIGKITVPAEILSRPGRISDAEFNIIKTHAQAGYNVLKDIEFPWPVAQIVLQHHERLDGSGYPQGLKDGGIMLEARILAVADVVEAMASHRPYRPALGIEAALEEITKNRGVLYDPEVADICARLFIDKGFALGQEI